MGATALRLGILVWLNPGLKQPWAMGRNRVAVETEPLTHTNQHENH